MSLNEKTGGITAEEAAEQKRLAQLQCSIDNQDACLMCSG
jgi:ribonucleoside-diphosphate reductase subunit M1